MELSNYKYIVGYGIGQYYNFIKRRIPDNIHIDYLCDIKWKQLGEEYDGIPIISPEVLSKMKDVFVLVFTGSGKNYSSICKILDGMQIPYAHAGAVLEIKSSIRGSELKQSENGVWEDKWNNRIIFPKDMADNISISFKGENNQICISPGINVGTLYIECGNNAVCNIGDDTEINDCQIFVTDGSVNIGKDCLFSSRIIIRNHDGHHIFDVKTGKRINYSGNISIGNHVWVGYGAVLLGSASIGDNSVVGSMAVTSGTFPKEVVIAGSPAKIIRNDICWSKDATDFYQWECLDECLGQEALKYM